MKTKIFKCQLNRVDKSIIKETAQVIVGGGITIFPTDTVYGIGVNAFCADAVRNVYHLKKRNQRKPLILLVSDYRQAVPFIENIPPVMDKLMKKFWPGPLTLVLKASHIGMLVTGGHKTIGIRVPDNKIVFSLIKECEIPLATTSANISNEDSPIDACSLIKTFSDKVDIIIDAGKTVHRKESTVLDLSHFPFHVVREGVIKKSELLKVAGLD